MVPVLATMAVCAAVLPDPPGAVDIGSVLPRFPAAIRVEASAYVNGEQEPNQKIKADLRPDSVVASSSRRMDPAGFVTSEYRYDSLGETIIFHPGTSRATRSPPFLSTVGMSAVESIVSPYGFVRAIRRRAEAGGDVRVQADGDLTILSAPAGGVGVPALRIEVEHSSGRIVRVVYGDQAYRFSNYGALSDGTEFPRRCETIFRTRDAAIESVVVYDRVEPIEPGVRPARPVFENSVVIDDAISGAVTDGAGKPVAPRQTGTRTAWMGLPPDTVLIGMAVVILIVAGSVWRRQRT